MRSLPSRLVDCSNQVTQVNKIQISPSYEVGLGYGKLDVISPCQGTLYLSSRGILR